MCRTQAARVLVDRCRPAQTRWNGKGRAGRGEEPAESGTPGDDRVGVAGVWVNVDGHVRQGSPPDGRDDEARGERRSACRGSETIS
ncbi:Atu4866 domain-containing protein [Streptomyces sp. NPDC059134]|uniref:Atu4866 domain-containing protein n=1 Tax=Streptomyces sp. NPDC059134 TaxID=3346738 RepID=UPI00369D76AB